VFAVFGAILFTLMCCICIIVLKLKGLICVGSGPIGQEGREQRRQERIEELKRKVIERLEVQLPTKPFAVAQNYHNEQSCCICFEDFQAATEIKETLCMHIFHAKCLREWIKTKFEKPDCP
jgi:hypothetical protein